MSTWHQLLSTLANLGQPTTASLAPMQNAGTIGPQVRDIDPGELFRGGVRNIESYTQEGRQEHPVLAALGDLLNRVGYTPQPNPKILQESVPFMPEEEFFSWRAAAYAEKISGVPIAQQRALEETIAMVHGADAAQQAMRAARGDPEEMRRLVKLYGEPTGTAIGETPWREFSAEQMQQLYEKIANPVHPSWRSEATRKITEENAQHEARSVMDAISKRPASASYYMRVYGIVK